MPFTSPDFLPAAPEIFLMVMACITLVVDVYVSERYRLLTYQLTQAAMIGTAVLVILLFPHSPQISFSGTFVNDAMASVLKVAALLVSFFAFFYARTYLRERNLFKGEFFVLGQFCVLGIMVLVSGSSLLTVYLGLELMSLCLYAMVALDRDSVNASEAAMKYFVLGALASGMLLYGMSMVYGVTGSLELAAVNEAVAAQEEPSIVLIFGLVFLLVGVAFKLGAVPFHMWVPDVYEGAPTAVTLFLGSAPKLAAFAMLMRLLVDALGGLHADWQQMLVVLAVLSMGVGNVFAIAQTNLKRMLAYSTIAHVGFLFLGVIPGTQSGYAAAMFYMIVYSIMAAAAFGMIILLGRSGFEADRLDDFRGLNERNPWAALLLLLIMFSMAGVPPLLGFWAKWSVLRELIAGDMVWLAGVAVFFSVIGLFYYLRVVKLAYFDKPEDHTPLTAGTDMRVALSANALLVLALGVYPSALMAVCVAALQG